MKIPPIVAEYFHKDGRTDGLTDTTILLVTFHNFATAPKNLKLIIFTTS